MEIIQKIKENVIIRNPASNHVFFACLAGKPATAGQADDARPM
jgi:hypothetical protein